MTISLFQREVRVAVLASGSRGNCTYIGDRHAGVLIDCGVSCRQVLRRLDAIELGDAPINAVLITHEHTDHVGGARVLCKQLRRREDRAVPFFMTEGTRQGLRPKLVPDAIELLEAGKPFQLEHLTIDPFSVPHDTRDPVGYRVRSGGCWAGVITDLGKPTSLVCHKLRELSIAVLEYNHDVELLMSGSYPWALKQRIRSSHGHLSNQQASLLLSRSLTPTLQHLLLAHLSEENNRPGIALQSAGEVLSEHGIEAQVSVQVARQREPLQPVSVRARDW